MVKSLLNVSLVSRLITSQFPQWKDFSVRSVAVGGWDNRTFHLGEQMLVRMPSAACYAGKVEKEHRWLPILAPLLPFQIPIPLVIGQPGEGYPWKWSVYRWLEGETAAAAGIANLCDFAGDLARFLIAFQSIDPVNGPQPGPDNFYRGGLLEVYDTQTRQAIGILKDKIDTKSVTEIWEIALATVWGRQPVWVHGDIAPGNLLVQDKRLSAVIDFGGLCVGDPACDLAIAWTFFDQTSREVLREKLITLDAGTWTRGRAWALWKALIVAAGLVETNAVEAAQPWCVIEAVLNDFMDERANDE